MFPYKVERTGQVIDVDWETHMRESCAGFINLPNGDIAKHVPENGFAPSADRRREDNKPDPPSDALGFTAHQLAEMEYDRRTNGFSGVEFVKDPHCDTFYQVKSSSRSEHERYTKHRGFFNKNHTVGGAVSAGGLSGAAEIINRKYK